MASIAISIWLLAGPSIEPILSITALVAAAANVAWIGAQHSALDQVLCMIDLDLHESLHHLTMPIWNALAGASTSLLVERQGASLTIPPSPDILVIHLGENDLAEQKKEYASFVPLGET